MVDFKLKMVMIFTHVTCQMVINPDPGRKPIPEDCGMTELMYKNCCLFPPFFTREVGRQCGARFVLNEVHNDTGVFLLKRVENKGCDYWICVLDKYDLITADDFVDDEKYFTHLDRWVELNPKFSNVMLKAKLFCKMNYKSTLPLQLCEFHDFHFCMRNIIKLNCPMPIQTPECNELIQFYDKCKEYYYR